MTHTEADDKFGVHVKIYAGLLALAAATTVLAFVNLGIWNAVIAIAIAFIQTALIFTFSMHLKGSEGFLKLLVVSSILFVLVLFGMTYNDFLSRQFVGSKLDLDTWISRSPNQYIEPAPAESGSQQHH